MGLLVPKYIHAGSGVTMADVYLTLLSDMGSVRCAKRANKLALFGVYHVFASLEARNAGRPAVCSDVVRVKVDRFDNPVEAVYAELKRAHPGAVDA